MVTFWVAAKAAVSATPFRIQMCRINSYAEQDVREHGIVFDPDLPRLAYACNGKADVFAKRGANNMRLSKRLRINSLSLKSNVKLL